MQIRELNKSCFFIQISGPKVKNFLLLRVTPQLQENSELTLMEEWRG